MASHEPILLVVGSTAKELIQSEHFSKDSIQSRWQELHDSWLKLKEVAAQRKLKLNESLESQEYYTSAQEAEGWMSEKRPLLSSEDYGRDEDSAEDLMKKNTALQQDLEVYSRTIDTLMEECERLLSNNHFDSTNLSEKQSRVGELYSELQDLASQRNRRLQESRQLHAFHREVNEVEEWIAEKEKIATLQDHGKDLEHVVILQKKHEDFAVELAAGEERVITVETLAKSLLDDNHSNGLVIQERLDNLRQLWSDLNELMQLRREALAGAKEIHAFDHDAHETQAWIQEKEAAVSSEDYGRDLASVQALQRKHEGLVRDLGALEERVHNLEKECDRLVCKFPEAAPRVQHKQEELTAQWDQLTQRVEARKGRLDESEQLHSYLNTFRDLNSWINDMLSVIRSDKLAKDVVSADALLARHRERRAEMDTRDSSFASFTADGESLIDKGHFASEEIQEKIEQLDAAREILIITWEERQTEFEHCKDTQLYCKEAQQAEAWITLREAFLANEDLGDSLDVVEELLRKQSDFEKTLAAQEEKFSGLNRETAVEEQERVHMEAEEQRLLEEQQAAERKRLKEEEERKKKLEAVKLKQESERKQREEELRKQQREAQRRAEEEDRRQRDEEEKRKREAERRKAEQQRRLEEEQRMEEVRRRQVVRLSADSTDSKPYRSTSPEAPKPMQEKILKWECEGVLQRKNELDEGGRKSANRSWKAYYTVLSDQHLHFFKDRRDFTLQTPAAPAINIGGGRCDVASDYTKRKNVMRLRLHNGAEYLFLTNDVAELQQWVSKISVLAAQGGQALSDTDDTDDLDIVSPLRSRNTATSPSPLPSGSPPSKTTSSVPLHSPVSSSPPPASFISPVVGSAPSSLHLQGETSTGPSAPATGSYRRETAPSLAPPSTESGASGSTSMADVAEAKRKKSRLGSMFRKKK